MKIGRKAFMVAAFVLLSSLGVRAQGQEVLSFTRIERNPRASALAGAGAASVSGAAYASFSNSAIIPFYEGGGDFAAGYEYWAPSLGAAHAMNVAGAYNFGPVGVSLGGVYQLEQADYDGYRPSEMQINAGLGARFLSWLGLGINVRYVRENLFQGYSHNGFGVDALLLFAPVKGLTLTSGVANIGSVVKDSADNQYHQPTSIKAAAAYNLQIGLKNALEFMLDEDYFIYGKSNAISFGMEYSYDKMVFARLGYRIASEKASYPSHLGLGLGAQYKGFRLDVSYLTLSEAIGNTVAVGLGYRF